jgi:hypothetical protein
MAVMPVIEEKPFLLQQPAHGAEVHGQVSQSHVLEHPHARDLVVEPFAGRIPIVLQQHSASALEPRFADALVGKLELVLGERDARRIDAIFRRGADREGAPSAADVEKALAGLEAQLRANVVELLQLRRLEAVAFLPEVSARVHHARVEPELVELVGHVVVMLDRLAIAAPGVARVR